MLPSYGVLIGTYSSTGQHQGQWLHEMIYANAAGTRYEAAVDVNEPSGIFQYMIINSMDPKLFANVSSLADGWHHLDSTPTSGAIDYIRSPFVQQAEGCLAAMLGFLRLFGSSQPLWNDVTGDEAGNALGALVTGAKRLYIFGAPYVTTNPPGVHDVHMNQGDPPGPHQHDDGIWQDGCVIVEKADGKLAGYFGKFATQSLSTDSNGLPTGG